MRMTLILLVILPLLPPACLPGFPLPPRRRRPLPVQGGPRAEGSEHHRLPLRQLDRGGAHLRPRLLHLPWIHSQGKGGVKEKEKEKMYKWEEGGEGGRKNNYLGSCKWVVNSCSQIDFRSIARMLKRGGWTYKDLVPVLPPVLKKLKMFC